MDKILKKCPLPIAGLILGLAALGNLIQSYGDIYRNILGTAAGLLLVLFLSKLLLYPKQVREDLNNPVIASVFPTFSMAIMLISTYIKPHSNTLAFLLWIAGLCLHIALIIWFSVKFVFKFKIKQVFPSWFIVYVGIVVASVSGSAFDMADVGKAAFWFGFVTYIILLFIVLYRVLKVKEMPELTLPLLIILAAPASLLLAGYMNSFTEKSMFIVYFLMTLSFVFYLAALVMLPKLLSLKFYPSYSAFTFPLIISGIGMKLANGFLTKSNHPIALLKYLIVFQVIVAVAITLYVLFRYIQFLTASNKATQSVQTAAGK